MINFFGRALRVLTYRNQTPYEQQFALPQGWRPRTMIDVLQREVEPWLWMLTDERGAGYDAGECWLEVGRDPDEAAHEILEGWYARQNGALRPEWLTMRMLARPATYVGRRVGIASVAELVLTQ